MHVDVMPAPEAMDLDPAIVRLKEHLLSLGGDRIQFDRVLVRDIKPELAELLLAVGRLSTGRRARRVKGKPRACHQNAARNVEKHADWTWETGLALSRDGMWRVHSWNRDKAGRIVETTTRRTRYLGVDARLDPDYVPGEALRARDHLSSVQMLAVQLTCAGFETQALRVADRAIDAIARPLGPLLLLRAHVLGELDRAPEGHASIDTALGIVLSDDDRARCLDERAKLLWAEGRYEASAAVLDEALALTLDAEVRAELLLHRARVVMRCERPANALEAVTLGLAIDASEDIHFELVALRVDALMACGRHEEAVLAADEALVMTENPSARADLLTARARAAARLERWEDALAAIGDALALAPSDESRAVCLGLRAWYLCRLDRPDEGLAAADEALSLTDGETDARLRASIMLNRAFAVSRLGRRAEALTIVLGALDLDATNPNLWFDRACHHAMLGHLDESLVSLERAITLDPAQRAKGLRDADFAPFADDEVRWPRLLALLGAEPQWLGGEPGGRPTA